MCLHLHKIDAEQVRECMCVPLQTERESVCVCVFERERERQRERERERERAPAKNQYFAAAQEDRGRKKCVNEFNFQKIFDIYLREERKTSFNNIIIFPRKTNNIHFSTFCLQSVCKHTVIKEI